MKRKRLWQWLPVILIIVGVFYSSSTPYVEQDVRPEIGKYLDMNEVAAKYGWVKFDYAGSEISVDALGPASFVEFFIRKATHFTVFFGLGFLSYRAMRVLGNHSLKSGVTAFLVVLLNAAFDEFHQSFTPGRTPHVEDVIIDITGGLTAIVIASLIYRFKKKKTSTRIL